MARSDNKFNDIAKIPEMVIDGVKGIEPNSAEWHFFFWKKRYFDFLLDLIDGRKDPNLENPLDTWDWDYLPEPSDDYDQNSCAESLLKFSERGKGVNLTDALKQNNIIITQLGITKKDELETTTRLTSRENKQPLGMLILDVEK